MNGERELSDSIAALRKATTFQTASFEEGRNMIQELANIYFAKMLRGLGEGEGISPKTHPKINFFYTTSNHSLKEYNIAA